MCAKHSDNSGQKIAVHSLVGQYKLVQYIPQKPFRIEKHEDKRLRHSSRLTFRAEVVACYSFFPETFAGFRILCVALSFQQTSVGHLRHYQDFGY